MEIKTVGVACDHAGYPLKQFVIQYLEEHKYAYKDFGCNSDLSCDYPDYAHPMGQAIESGELSRGISVCGSGNGISMVMNKYSKVRAALCWDVELAKLAREHNDANVLSIPARFVSEEQVKAILTAFLDTPFEGGRHEARVAKIPIKH